MNRYIKDALFGAIGGIAGTFVIQQAMAGISKLQSEKDKRRKQELVPEHPTERAPTQQPMRTKPELRQVS